MKIVFTKTDRDEHVFSCIRKDHSTTWQHVSPFFMMHDLCHYAVETTLALKNAFFGIVASGIDITNFDLPKEQRNIQLTEEAIFAEHLVNLFVIDNTQGKMENLIEIFTDVYDVKKGSKLLNHITEEKMDKIRKTYNDLLEQWKSTPVSESLNLMFEE